MNDPANSIQKVKTHKHLPCDFFYNVDRQAFAVILFQHLPKVYA